MTGRANKSEPGGSETATETPAPAGWLTVYWRGLVAALRRFRNNVSVNAPSASIAERVRLRQISTLMRDMPVMAVTAIVNATLVTAVLWQDSPGLLLGSWYACTVLLWLAFIVRRLRRRKAAGPFRARPRTLRRAVWRAGVSGGLWGAAALMLIPGGAPVHQLIITFVVGGMSAGAVASMSCFPAACWAFILASLLPLVAAFLLIGDTASLAMGLMVFAYISGLIVLSRNGYRTFIEAIWAEHENGLLLGRVSATHARLVEAIENVPAGIVFCDADDRLLVSNEHFKRWMCPGREEEIGPGLLYAELLEISASCASKPLKGAVRRAWHERRMEQHRDPGALVEFELADGRIARVMERRTGDGGTIGVFTDITDLKQHESEISAQSALLHAILENMAQGVVAFDANLTILASNERMSGMLDTPSELLEVGKNFGNLIERSAWRGDYGPGDPKDLLKKVLATARGHEAHRFERTMPDNSTLEAVAAPLRDGGFVVTYSDVTERKRYEEQLETSRRELNTRVVELEEMQQRLEVQGEELRQLAQHLAQARDIANAANKAKSDFLANMSHELRTPLNAILGFSEIMNGELLGPLGNPQYRQYADDIHESGSHLLSLINDILDLSKIEAGRMELHEERIDIAETVGAAIRIIRERAEAAELALVSEVEEGLPAVYADGRAIKQVLLNLLANSVKFTGPGGRVDVTAKRDPTGGIAITVSDNGVGMTPSDIKKSLQPFGQADSSLSRQHNGTGLGLPLSNSMMVVHGGRLSIDSQPGEGTTATATLPPERVLSTERDRARDLAG